MFALLAVSGGALVLIVSASLGAEPTVSWWVAYSAVQVATLGVSGYAAGRLIWAARRPRLLETERNRAAVLAALAVGGAYFGALVAALWVRNEWALVGDIMGLAGPPLIVAEGRGRRLWRGGGRARAAVVLAACAAAAPVMLAALAATNSSGPFDGLSKMGLAMGVDDPLACPGGPYCAVQPQCPGGNNGGVQCATIVAKYWPLAIFPVMMVDLAMVGLLFAGYVAAKQGRPRARG